MRDFLPATVRRRRYVVDIVQRVYESYGFVPLETPSVEKLSTLLGKYGEEGDQLVYRILHRGDKLGRALEKAPVTEETLAEDGLRYDLTVPLARVLAQYGDLPRFFKRYQIQPVWRADRPAKGRFREFWQCDVDVTGTQSLVAEAEVCAAVAQVLVELGFDDFTVRINHRQLLRESIRACGIASDLEETALVAIDKLDKIGRDGVLAEFAKRGVDAAAGERLLTLLTRNDGETEADVAARLREGIPAEAAQQVLCDLETLLGLLDATPAKGRAQLDPTLARGLGYYTGPIFEIAVADLAGSLGGGGRYDQLVGMFGKKPIPAIGFSLGLERILLVMEDRGMYPDLAAGPDVALCYLDVETADILAAAHALRAQGLKVEIYPESTRKLGKQLQYADSLAACVAGILGPDEVAEGAMTLKHLASGKQARVAVDRAAETIAAWGEKTT